MDGASLEEFPLKDTTHKPGGDVQVPEVEMVDHESSCASRTQHTAHFMEDLFGVGRVMNHAPTPDEIKALIREISVFGVDLCDGCVIKT